LQHGSLGVTVRLSALSVISELPVIGHARFYGQEFPMKRFCGFPPPKQ
jgi:hypothetical protein